MIESSTAELDRKMGKIRIDKDVKSSLEKAVRAKQDLEERMEKLQSDISESAPLFENVDKLISSLSEVKKKISAEKKRLAEESGAIFSALDEEVANYSTFQKIKEKSDAKIADYLKQLEKIDADYGRISKETEKTTKEFEGSLAKFQGSSDYAKAQELSEMVDKLMEKRALLEQIKSGMDSLDASAEKVSRQVKLLSKEVELVQFRASSSHEEGAQRDWAVGTKRFLGESGRLRKLVACRLRWHDGKMEEIAGSEFELPADLVLLAMGFVSPAQSVLREFGVATDARGNAKAGSEEIGGYATSVPGIFSAGDMRRGQSLVVWAIREGRQCARAVDEFLMGRSELPR